MAKESIGKVTLLGARLSFAALFEPDSRKQDDGTIRETWKSNFLFEKGDDGKIDEEYVAIFKGKRMPTRKAIQLAADEAKEKKWGDKKNWPKLKPDRVFVRDGDLEDWDGYPDHIYISANAPLTDRPSVITNRKGADGKWIEAEPGGKGAPYSGCYVNAVIEVWAQDNEHGKRLNAKVKAVQFLKDGEPFGAAPVDPNEEFDEDMVGEEGEIGGDFDGDDDDDDDGGMV